MEFHPTSDEARGVDLSNQNWLHYDWTRVRRHSLLILFLRCLVIPLLFLTRPRSFLCPLFPFDLQQEAEDFLKDAAKGAFIIRKSKEDHVLALQCGPVVQNRIGHMRLAAVEHKGKAWINVSGKPKNLLC